MLANKKSNITLPDYLIPINTVQKRYYGTLTYDISNNTWIIKGEPCVLELAKRVFRGCDNKTKGQARFYNNKRLVGELNWLMLRYPLEVIDKETWYKCINEASEYALLKEEIYERPHKVTPPSSFIGNLMDYQKEGLAFMLHNKRSLLADEMGLGKTVQALAFMAATKSYPAIVVCPSHLMINWQKEINKFLKFSSNAKDNSNNQAEAIHIIKGLKPYDLPPANVYIIHYLLLRGWKKTLPEYGFKAVFFDEIQELRHKGTEKYSAASLLAERANNVIGLSGTPIYNRGGEIWNVLNIIEYHCLGDWDSFTREWCNGYGSDVVAQPNLLGDYLKREGLMVRRIKNEVLSDLPPKRRVVQTIDIDNGIFSSMIQETLEKVKTIEDIKEPFERGRVEREIVNSTRQATGVAKASSVCLFVKMLLDAGEKILLFAYHHSVFDIYLKDLKDYIPMCITGRETKEQKLQAEEAFMSDKTNLLIISLRAAAGLNLQKANCVVFGELDWSPAIHSQAEDRAHRYGLKDSVLCYYLVCDTGTDEDIQDSLGLKVSQFIGLMGDKAETNEDRVISQVEANKHMKNIIEKLKARTLK